MNSLIKYDRTVRIMELEFKIRFIPSFVKRVKEWNKKLKKSESCPFCERWSETSVLDVPLFKIIENDYPFMNNQFTVFGEKHMQFFNSYAISSAISLIDMLPNCRSGGIQIKGSGATVPYHAHFSISDVIYPICTLRREILVDCGLFKISRILGVPHLALVISADVASLGVITNKILENLYKNKLSYNVLMTEKHEIIIVPRINENSNTLGRKIGISFVGGIYPCCVNASYSEEDPTIILNDIYQHWKNVSDRDILQAFKETTISFEVNLQDISNIIGFDLNR